MSVERGDSLEAIEQAAWAAFDSDEWSDDGMAHVLNSQGEWLAEFGVQSNAAFSAAANPQTVLALAAELREARAEIARHHEDFAKWEAMAAKGAGLSAIRERAEAERARARRSLGGDVCWRPVLRAVDRILGDAVPSPGPDDLAGAVEMSSPDGPPGADAHREQAETSASSDEPGAAPASDTEQTCQWYSHRHNVFLRCTLPPKHSGDHHLVAPAPSVEGSET